MRLPVGGHVTGWAACRLHGANFCDGLAPDGVTPLKVPLAVGPRGNLAPNDDARPVFRRVPPAEATTRYGVPVARIRRATYDAILLAPDEREAVVAVDNVLAAGLVSLRMLREYAASQPRERLRVRWVLNYADERSLSPNETRLRLLWQLDAELPRPLVNCPVHDLSGRLLGVADLLDLRAGLVVEFHGADHRSARRQTRDVQKEERLRRVGLEVTGVTGLELHDRPALADRLLAARGRAAFLPPEERRWVARPPAYDLHQRLVEREVLRELNERVLAEPVPDISELRGW